MQNFQSAETPIIGCKVGQKGPGVRQHVKNNALQFFAFLNDFIMIKYGANNIVEFVWGDDFLCYALSGVILEVVADGTSTTQGGTRLHNPRDRGRHL